MAAATAPIYLAEPPPGQVRTTVNPPFSAGSVVPAGIATTIIAIVCVSLRVFTRVHVVSGDLGSDDYLVLCALGFSIAFLFVGRHLFEVGGGLHAWDILLADYSPAFLQTTVGATLTYAISISFSKLSILAFYLRVSPDQNFRRAVYLLIGVVCAYTVSYILVIVFRCQPLAAGWDLAVKGRCIDYLVPMMVLSIANILIDLVILCLPIKVIVPLQIPTRQKLSLVFLFATGGFVCAAAIKRTIIMPPLLASTDYAWDLPEQFVWSFVEVNAGVVCASLAALKPLFMRYIPFLIVSRLRSSQERSTAPDSSAPGTDKNASSSTHTTVYGEALELPSREDLPAPTVVGHRDRDASDDEAQLWSHGRKPASSLNSDSNRNDADSVDGLGGAGGGGGHGGAGGGDLYPGARPPRFTVSGSGYGMAGPRSPDAIQVTKETLVSYGK